MDGGVADAPYVLVQVGATLVYPYDLPAVRTFAGRCTPATGDQPGLLTPSSLTAVSVAVRSKQPSRLLLVAAPASPGGRAHLAVTVCPMTVVDPGRRLRQADLPRPGADAFTGGPPRVRAHDGIALLPG